MEEVKKQEIQSMIDRLNSSITAMRTDIDTISLMRFTQPNDALEQALSEQLASMDKAMATRDALLAAIAPQEKGVDA